MWYMAFLIVPTTDGPTVPLIRRLTQVPPVDSGCTLGTKVIKIVSVDVRDSLDYELSPNLCVV